MRKCPYCDFNSHAAPRDLPEPAYLHALLADLEATLDLVTGRPIGSIFIGGGTPSLFSPETIARLLSGVLARLPLLPGAEITLEANPGAVEAGRFAEFRAAGVNRLSIGVQSFDDACLQRLGRVHDAQRAIAAVVAAQQAGFQSVNLDLMFGLPGQSLAQAEADVRQACALAPKHLSYYELTLEPGTPFYQNPPVLPQEDDLSHIQAQGQALIAEAGFVQYEVSAYAQPGYQCQHNRNYWEFGDYLGIGAGAHAKLSLQDGRILRQARCKHPSTYLAAQPGAAQQAEVRILAEADRVAEFMLGALRLTAGFPQTLLEERTGLPWQTVAVRCKIAQERRWLTLDAGWVRPTPLGQCYLNEVIALFFP